MLGPGLAGTVGLFGGGALGPGAVGLGGTGVVRLFRFAGVGLRVLVEEVRARLLHGGSARLPA
ncbi:hypothetical protein AB0M19_27405 [Streptomyces sp. NPDC051920]|uniref:hypothetical protein n=1 Tax=Streptomyces sp. NPDC051920 TaxID=3155523 RepID=UPI00342DC1FD